MCIAIDTIRFCTCKEKNLEEISIGKWFFYRGEKNFNAETVVGMVIGTDVNKDPWLHSDDLCIDSEEEEWRDNSDYSEYFINLLEKNNPFDFDIQYQEDDRIFIKLKNRIVIELFYSEEAWQTTDFISPFRKRRLMIKGKATATLQINGVNDADKPDL